MLFTFSYLVLRLCCLDYSADFTLLALRISYDREVYASNSLALLLGPPANLRSHPSCLQYFMRGRVTYQEVFASDSTAMLPGWTLDYSSGWTLTTLQVSSFFPLVSHAGESSTYGSSRSVLLLVIQILGEEGPEIQSFSVVYVESS